MSVVRMTLKLSFLFVFFLLAACTSLTSVDVGSPGGYSLSEISVGDDVIIKKHDGDTLEFMVTKKNASTIAGRNVIVDVSDILQVKVKKISATKTVGLGVGVTAIIYAIAIAIVSSAF